MATLHDLDITHMVSGKNDIQIGLAGCFGVVIAVKATTNGAKSVYIAQTATSESDKTDIGTDLTSSTAEVTVTTGATSGAIAVAQLTRPTKRWLNISAPANTILFVARTELLYIPTVRGNYTQVDLG